eukprot:SAG11_NODE_6614_length_1279_cov_1.126271_1_plen_406_part_10
MKNGSMHLLAVNPGTQAERHTQLRAGLVLTSAAGQSVKGLNYKEALGMLRAGGRPLTLGFSSEPLPVSPRATAAVAAAEVDAPSETPMEAAETEQAETPMEVAAAEQTEDDYLSQLERELSSAGLMPDAEAASTTVVAVERAMAEPERVDNVSMHIERGAMVVTFKDAGSLGISFGSKSESHPPFVKGVKEGSMGAQCEGLMPGLTLHAVNDVPVSGFSKALQQIQAAGRPLRLAFKPPDQIAVEERRRAETEEHRLQLEAAAAAASAVPEPTMEDMIGESESARVTAATDVTDATKMVGMSGPTIGRVWCAAVPCAEATAIMTRASMPAETHVRTGVSDTIAVSTSCTFRGFSGSWSAKPRTELAPEADVSVLPDQNSLMALDDKSIGAKEHRRRMNNRQSARRS